MPQLAALGLQSPNIDTMGSFTQGAANALALNQGKFAQAERGLQVIGSVALGAMGGKLDGPVDPQKFEQGLDLLSSQGINVEKFRGKPQLAPFAARASMTALQQLQAAQSEREYELALQRFGFELQKAERELAQGPETGLTPIYAEDENGNTVLLQATKDGRMIQSEMPPGVTPSTGFDKIDAGTHFVIKDKKTGDTVGIVEKDVRGEEREKAIGRGEGELQAGAHKADATLRSLESQWQLVDQTIDKALEEIDWTNVGFVGNLTSAVAGTPAYDVARTLETIKANIGFDKLQDMRDNSPTGGALGQVSEFENRLLQSVRGSLEQGQSPEQLRANLEQVQKDLKALQKERRRAFQETYGGAPEGGSSAPVETAPEASGDMPEITSREQYDALPSGATFMSNGKKWRKP